MDWFKTFLTSNRVKAFLIGIALAYLQKAYPELSLDEETLGHIYDLLLAFMALDTIRPANPAKSGLVEHIVGAMRKGK